jgi:CTP:molybdopterin cytidylyltransferase MocA
MRRWRRPTPRLAGLSVSRPDLIVAVLAAGASRRLGRAKQLVPIAGEPLLRRQCACALTAQVGPVMVILGCNADQHKAVIADLPVEVHLNDEWAEGMAATLRCAIRAATARGAALFVLPCDQYRILPSDLRMLYDRWCLAPSTACLSRWHDYAGPPAILPIDYHGHVLELRGDVGARSILYDARHPPPYEMVNPRARFDLDSPEDVTIADAWRRMSASSGSASITC